MGRRRRRRQLAAIRRAAGLRRSARRVFRDAPGVRAADAGTHHRRVGRRARQHRVPDGAADARAAHPPREGDVEHLHGARRCWRTSPGSTPSITAPTGWRPSRGASTALAAALAARARGSRRPPAERRLLRHAALRRARTARPAVGRVRAGRAGRARINFRYRDDGTINVALDETTDADDVAAIASVRARHRRRWRESDASGRNRRTIRPALARTSRVPDASGVQHASFRNADDAVPPQASSARTSASTRR